mgnify:FL=1
MFFNRNQYTPKILNSFNFYITTIYYSNQYNVMITILLVIAVAIGVFIFVKNNPNKTKQINIAVKDTANEIKEKLKK